MSSFIFHLPHAPQTKLAEEPDGSLVGPEGTRYPLHNGVLDLLDGAVKTAPTADHYSKQWGAKLGYVDFIRSHAEANKLTMARQLGWPQLFEQIRSRAASKPTWIYDAACGFGSIFSDLFSSPKPSNLFYLGCDIHHELATIPRPEGVDLLHARFCRWDISIPPPVENRFEYVLCRAAIHHTPDPEKTFHALVSVLRPGGTIAISAYTKKGIVREAADDALRALIKEFPPDEAYQLVRQLSMLGRDLQAVKEKVKISTDLPVLGIKAGEYPVQELVYDHMVKCWFNPAFGNYSDVVNFDWYHPEFAYRYELDELTKWFRHEKLAIVNTASNKAQHYVQGKKL